MSNPVSAAATGLPEVLPRRAFLGALSRLPFIGGGIAILGAPTASAEPVTRELTVSYHSWLYWERRKLSYEMAGGNCAAFEAINGMVFGDNEGWHWHELGTDWASGVQPSSRAALILSAVGCEWRQENV